MTTILIAHADPRVAERLSLALTDGGLQVVGVAQSARMALAMAAQVGASLAVVGEALAGRRDGRSLVEALDRTWGIPSLLLRSPPAAVRP